MPTQLKVKNAQFFIAVILAIQTIVFVDSIIPHIFVALRQRKYNPGFVTAIFINIPFPVHLFQQALIEKILELDEMLIMLAVAPLTMIILIRGFLKVAGLLQTR